MKTRGILPPVFVGLAALLIALAAHVASPEAQADWDDHDDCHLVAGSYWIEAELLVPGVDPIPVRWLFTLTSDGTVASDSSTDFGAYVTPRFRSTQRGEWRWAGRREVLAMTLSLDFDQETIGRFGTPENISATIPRITTTMRFDRRHKQFSLDGLVEIFLPDQDPLDPDEVPGGPTLGIEGEGVRIVPRL